MSDILVVTNERQFLEYIYSVLIDESAIKKIRFDGWPEINLDIKGIRYQSSLPIKLMEGIVGFQQEFDKAYASLMYNTSNRQKLTNTDKDALELVFTIKEGSTSATGGGSEWINGVFDKLDVVFRDMTGRQKMALLALVALAFAGTYIADSYLDNQTKQAMEDAKIALEKERSAQIAGQTAANTSIALEALRLTVVDESLKEVPVAGNKVIEHIDEGYKGIVRSVPDADKISIGTTTLTKDDIHRISIKPDTVKQVEELTDDFYIESMKKKNNSLILGVIKINNEDSFNIKADTLFLKEKESLLIHDAFQKDLSIKMNYQAKFKNGEITESRLIRVVDPASSISG